MGLCGSIRLYKANSIHWLAVRCGLDSELLLCYYIAIQNYIKFKIKAEGFYTDDFHVGSWVWEY